jgi:hypothetical protein
MNGTLDVTEFPTRGALPLRMHDVSNISQLAY